MEKGRSLIGLADVGGIVRVGINVFEDGPNDTLRADPVIVDDVRGVKLLAGRGYAAAGENAIGTGMQCVERTVVGAGVEMTRGAGDPAITAGLFVPDQRLTEFDRGRIVDDGAAGTLWVNNGRKRGEDTIGESEREKR